MLLGESCEGAVFDGATDAMGDVAVANGDGHFGEDLVQRIEVGIYVAVVRGAASG